MPKKEIPKPKHRLVRKNATSRQQCAAIPFRDDPDGGLQVLLVTSRRTHRWLVPKGWVPAKLTPAKAAAREAFEEAGVTGRIGATPVGSYQYEKHLTAHRTISCHVIVFALQVEQQLDIWPEKDQRNTKWFTPAEAASLVSEPELAKHLARSVPLRSRHAGPEQEKRAAGDRFTTMMRLAPRSAILPLRTGSLPPAAGPGRPGKQAHPLPRFVDTSPTHRVHAASESVNTPSN